jgi:hypothetical protein
VPFKLVTNLLFEYRLSDTFFLKVPAINDIEVLLTVVDGFSQGSEQCRALDVKTRIGIHPMTLQYEYKKIHGTIQSSSNLAHHLLVCLSFPEGSIYNSTIYSEVEKKSAQKAEDSFKQILDGYQDYTWLIDEKNDDYVLMVLLAKNPDW